MRNPHLFFLETKSNLHAGQSGEELSHIDKEVQREKHTHLPTINMSALKGALKEFATYKFAYMAHENDKAPGKKILRTIFGSEFKKSQEDSSDPDDTTQQGQIFFDSAKILSLPVRALKDYYYRATSDKIIESFLKECQDFNIKLPYEVPLKELLSVLKSDDFVFDSPIVLEESQNEIELDIFLEDERNELYTKYHDFKIEGLKEALWKIIGERVVILPHSLFEILAQDLPILDRNVLNDGETKNLWFEEVVPRESRFYFVLFEPHQKIAYRHEVNEAFKKFKSLFAPNENGKKDIVLIGGSNSVGYGRCFIDPLEEINICE